ncbi:ribbon-helix-helix domain-containing protein [Halobellus inordinatus]|uniref:ribbon-helix-helix domain-containing protein n=1 Tax=Halobellus inordinatus TaxID=1126236 RepID=UPI002113C5DD|nr:ribbon-helix-helix domain-containing protein [Halobellus ramosii]
MAHIGVSVDDDTKEKWDHHVEQSEYGSMSELIRSAVRKEIRRGGDEGQVPRQLEKELVQVAESQQAISDAVERLSEDFEQVEAAAQTQYPEEIVDLAMDIADEDIQEIHADQFADVEKEGVSDLQSLAQKHLDSNDIGKVADALDYLEENLSYVKSPPRTADDYYRVIGRKHSR